MLPSAYPKNIASKTIVKITPNTSNKQHALLLAFRWYLAADLNSTSAARVS